MNRLEIFQQVYSTDYVFTAKELEQLRQVTELVAQKCAEIADTAEPYQSADLIRKHFGVEK